MISGSGNAGHSGWKVGILGFVHLSRQSTPRVNKQKKKKHKTPERVEQTRRVEAPPFAVPVIGVESIQAAQAGSARGVVDD
jgi:hypothetical protein